MKWTSIDYFALDPGGKRPNVTGIWKGSGEGRNILFNGHSDVAPTPEVTLHMWKHPPYEPVIENGNIYGRGSNDMKSGNSAMVWAVKALMDLDIKLKGTVCLELVPAEERCEGGTLGSKPATQRLIDMGIDFPFVIVGEPTMCEIHTISNALFDFSVEIYGKDVHAACRNLTHYPQRYGIPVGKDMGVDANAKLVGLLLLFEKLEAQWNLRYRHPQLGGGGSNGLQDFQGVGAFVLNPSFIKGGTFIASVSGYASCECQVYYPGWLQEEEIWQDITKAIEAYSSTDDWLREHPPKVQRKEGTRMPSYKTDVRDPGCVALGTAWQRATGKPAIFSGFKALDDAGFIQQIKPIPCVSMGPGDLSMSAHGPNEYVPIDQIMKCCKTYAAMMIDWCGLEAE